MLILQWCVLCLLPASRVMCEVFTSVAAMENLIELQGSLLATFDVFMHLHKDALVELNGMVESFRYEYEEASKNPAEYIGNPVDSYRILKSLFIDWNDVITLMRLGRAELEADVMDLSNNTFFPEKDDLQGSAETIMRLQSTYNLKTVDLAEGKLNGIQTSSPLTSHDCFMIGVCISEAGSYTLGLEWFEVALEKFIPNNGITNYKDYHILEYIAYNKFKIGEMLESLRIYEYIRMLYPNYTEILSRIESTEDAINNKTFMENLDASFVDPHTLIYPREYDQLCREEIDRHPSIMKDLTCKYISTETPFSKIAPFKMEQHYFEPNIYVFHDVLYDSEIEHLKIETKHLLQRAKVIHQDQTESADRSRVSLNAWLANDHSPIVKRINRRFEDMTGLSMQYSEDMQIADYGIGGYFGPHLDFAQKHYEEAEGVDLRNRLATFVVYMSDVEMGGNTVFPDLGISIRPQKGSALFWYNLYESGEGNTATMHAACPVLKGNKWAVNKWVKLLGNEALRPCNLIYQEEGPSREHPKLVKVKKLQ